MEENVRNFSECYFGYKMNIGKDELNLAEKRELWPKIYLEKDVNQVELFFTFPDWFNPINTNQEREYIYEEIQIGFDPKGYLINNIIQRINQKEDNDMVLSGSVRYNDKCIVEFGRYSLKQKYCSGIGYISLKKDGAESIIYFAINYGKKKKIYYTIDKNRITFKTRNDIDELKIKVYFNEDRLPCLANEAESSCENVTVKFYNHSGIVNLKNNHYKSYKYIDLGGDTPEEIQSNKQMYLLIREEDYTNTKKITNIRQINSIILCPYCNEEIKVNTKDLKNGVFCDGKVISKISNNFKLFNEKNKRHTNYIICKKNYLNRKNDAGDLNNVPIAPYRLLPDNILNRRNYRIAIVGKARSGKTAYISRLLNVTGSYDRLIISPEMNLFFEYYNIRSSDSRLIVPKRDQSNDNSYEINPIPYYSGKNANREAKSFFNKYAISFENKKFIEPTREGARDHTTEYPFILNVNNKAYVNIYDIAGEDVENGVREFNIITNGDNTSVIVVLDVSKGQEINRNILENTRTALANRKKNSPIAIVLSKFDTIEYEFNSNCACLSNDYLNLLTKNLTDSSLIHHIDAASLEIESYLKHIGLDVRAMLVGFNIKFFSTSIITYSDAIYHKDNDSIDNEVNGLNFMSSTKRVELPILWILHELGEL